MSYNITFYSQTGVKAPDLAFDAILSYMDRQGLPVRAAARSSGEGWESGHLHLENEETDISAIRLEVHVNSELVKAMVGQVAAEDFSGVAANADTVSILTLAGDIVNWNTVREVWSAIEAQWPTSAYDDGSGFETSIEALG